MVLIVDGKTLSSLFGDFIRTKKVMFNFETDGQYIDVQVLEDYTACTRIPILENQDGDRQKYSVSFWVTKAIGVLDSGSPVKLTFTEATLIIEQSTFMSTFLKEYEERRSFPSVDGLELRSARAQRLKYITHNLVTCASLAGELNISEPDPMFSGGCVYSNYRQSFFIEDIDYPELSITMSVLKEFVFKLNEKAEFYFFEDLDTIYYKSAEYEFWIPTCRANISTPIIKAVNDLKTQCVPVTKVSFRDYKSRIQILASAVGKQKVSISFTNGGFVINVTSTDIMCRIGNGTGDCLCSISITPAQLMLFSKMFGDDEEVEVLRGGNCICLRVASRNMLIAGLVF